ncbi:unnamed protein product [Calypogeia fissa]
MYMCWMLPDKEPGKSVQAWARHESALGALLCVFRGTCEYTNLAASEVYDPEVDEWTAISPMACGGFRHTVGIIGEELLVYGGMGYRHLYPHEGWFTLRYGYHFSRADRMCLLIIQSRIYGELVYQKRMIRYGTYAMETLIGVLSPKDKLHVMVRSGISTFDFAKISLEALQFFSDPGVLEDDFDFPREGPQEVVVLDEELVRISVQPPVQSEFRKHQLQFSSQ